MALTISAILPLTLSTEAALFADVLSPAARRHFSLVQLKAFIIFGALESLVIFPLTCKEPSSLNTLL